MSSDILCPKESLKNVLAFSSKDWSLSEDDAWVYGVVLGWDDNSLKELKYKFAWSDRAVERLKLLHRKFKED